MAQRGDNIRKRKDGRWEGRYIKARTPEGKIQWGYVYGTAYAEVKRVLIQRKAEAGFYNLKQTGLTFEVLAEVWLYSLKNAIKESAYAHYSYTLHKYLLPVLSKVPVASLNESFLEQAMQQIITPTDAAHKPLGNSSARECLSMLRRICKYAAHLRLIRPMELEVALPKSIDKISAPLSPAEQQRLYQYVQENPTPRKIGLLLGLELGNSTPKAVAYYAEKAARKRQQCCMVPVRQRVQANRPPLLSEKHQSVSEAGDCPSRTPARAAPPVCQAHDKKYILQKQKSQTTNFNLIVWGFCFCVALVPLFLLKMPVTVWHFHITNSHQGFLIITDSVY